MIKMRMGEGEVTDSLECFVTIRFWKPKCNLSYSVNSQEVKKKTRGKVLEKNRV